MFDAQPTLTGELLTLRPLRPDDFDPLVAIDRADGRVVGSSRYYAYDPAARQVEIGWSFLARSHWGGRYNREMKTLMLQHAFTFVDRVLFLVGQTNVRSQRAMAKIGGVPAGTRRNVYGVESIVFEIRAPDGAR